MNGIPADALYYYASPVGVFWIGHRVMVQKATLEIWLRDIEAAAAAGFQTAANVETE